MAGGSDQGSSRKKTCSGVNNKKNRRKPTKNSNTSSQQQTAATTSNSRHKQLKQNTRQQHTSAPKRHAAGKPPKTRVARHSEQNLLESLVAMGETMPDLALPVSEHRHCAKPGPKSLAPLGPCQKCTAISPTAHLFSPNIDVGTSS